ncbi:hypothetical protein [Streptomyces cadmiisoli]|uniref:hypothetical protein n=1 Tax=Streptomyces cadmiisoli TaxID=2184053 RepID=UPI00364CB4A9
MTTGHDERTLHVIPGDGPETEQQAEDRIRQELHRRVDGTSRPAPSPPPLPSHPPAIPSQPDADAGQEPGEEKSKQAAPVRALNDRLVEWWRADKPGALDPDTEDDDEDDEDDEEQPAAHGPRPSRRRVSKRSAKDDGDDEPDEKDGTGRKSKGGPRWSRPVLGRPPGLPAEKHNLFTWYRGMEPHTRWLIYHGTGLGAGFYFGVTVYGYEGHRFIATHPAGDPEALATWGLLGGLLMADYHVRNLFPLLAWAVRALSTSVTVGALWYSAPLAH